MVVLKAAAIIGILLLVFGLVGKVDQVAEQQEFNHYCRMVKTYQETDGAFGWPDYRNLYQECGDVSPAR